MFYSDIDQHKRDSFITTYDDRGAIVNQERVPNTTPDPTVLHPIPRTPQSRSRIHRQLVLARRSPPAPERRTLPRIRHSTQSYLGRLKRKTARIVYQILKTGNNFNGRTDRRHAPHSAP